MIRAFALSLGQLTDAATIRVLVKSLVLTLLVLATAGTGIWLATRWLVTGWLHVGEDWAALAGIAEIAAAIAFGWLLFRIVAIAVIGLFGDEIVVAVERRHYPTALANARHVPFHRALSMGLASAARALAVNLVLAPAYIVLLLTGLGTPVLFFVVNGWLLGIDLGEMVAVRHLPREGMKAWRVSTRWSRWGLGLLVSGLLTIPLVNLIAPIIGAAMATHLFHGRTS